MSSVTTIGPRGMREEMETSGAAGLQNVTRDGVAFPDAWHIPAAPSALHAGSREKKCSPGADPSLQVPPTPCQPPLPSPAPHACRFAESPLLVNRCSLSDPSKREEEAAESCEEQSGRAPGGSQRCSGAHARPGCAAVSGTKNHETTVRLHHTPRSSKDIG